MLSKSDWAIVKELTITDFKLKYNRSVLGFFWSLIKPFLMLGTLYFVFTYFFQLDVDNYSFFLLFGIILWGFFVEATSMGMASILNKSGLITKLYFRREIIILSAVISALITLLLNLAVFFVFWIFLGQPLFVTVLFLPLILAELFVISLGSAYALAALHAKYRDVSHIWEVISQVGFWVTPIIYPVTFIPEPMLKWYMLNPMARIINDARNAVIYNGVPSLWHNAITAAACILIYFIGMAIFKKYSKIFGETV